MKDVDRGHAISRGNLEDPRPRPAAGRSTGTRAFRASPPRGSAFNQDRHYLATQAAIFGGNSAGKAAQGLRTGAAEGPYGAAWTVLASDRSSDHSFFRALSTVVPHPGSRRASQRPPRSCLARSWTPDKLPVEEAVRLAFDAGDWHALCAVAAALVKAVTVKDPELDPDPDPDPDLNLDGEAVRTRLKDWIKAEPIGGLDRLAGPGRLRHDFVVTRASLRIFPDVIKEPSQPRICARTVAKMAIPTNLDAFLGRKETAAALSEAGFPTSPATLSTKATRAAGPPFSKYGPRALYRWGSSLPGTESV